MSKETDLFISKNANDVIKSVQGTGFFPSLKMAQMIIDARKPKNLANKIEITNNTICIFTSSLYNLSYLCWKCK
jgi:hypothetical protein